MITIGFMSAPHRSLPGPVENCAASRYFTDLAADMTAKKILIV
jgi:hypothetical protein